MFPIPATRRWSTSASPTSRDWSLRRSRETTSAVLVAGARRSGPRSRAAPSPRASTGPFHCVASHSRLRRTSHGDPRHVGVGASPDAPAAVHAEVAPDDHAALEAKEQMLPDGTRPTRAFGRRPAKRHPSPGRADSGSRPRPALPRAPAGGGPHDGASRPPAPTQRARESGLEALSRRDEAERRLRVRPAPRRRATRERWTRSDRLEPAVRGDALVRCRSRLREDAPDEPASPRPPR